jgi:hypothetical protein
MFGASKELIKEEDKLLGTDSDEESIRSKREQYFPEIFKYNPISNMSMRQSGKKSNHGLNYDLGANGFAATYGMSIAEARRCYDLYHRAYPSLKVWHSSIRNKLSVDRTLENLFGRKRRFLNRWCDDLFKAAYSYIPQSTVAQLLNGGLIDIYENQDYEQALRDLDILSQVHDSMLAQYPVGKVDQFAEAILRCKDYFDKPMIANGREFSIRTDAKIGFDAKNLFPINIEGTKEELIDSINEAILKATNYRNSQHTVELEDEDEDNEDETE